MRAARIAYSLQIEKKLDAAVQRLEESVVSFLTRFSGICYGDEKVEARTAEANETVRLLAADIITIALVVTDSIMILSGYRPPECDDMVRRIFPKTKMIPGHSNLAAADIMVGNDNVLLAAGAIVDLMANGYLKVVNNVVVHYGFIHIGFSDKVNSLNAVPMVTRWGSSCDKVCRAIWWHVKPLEVKCII